MIPQFHFQNAFPTEGEAEKYSKQIIGETVIQKQDVGWCVFAVVYPDEEKAIKKTIAILAMREIAKMN
jgi:hypothetical protein